MKQLIILLSTIVLGVAIFGMIMGPGDDSIIGSMARMWRNCIGIRSY